MKHDRSIYSPVSLRSAALLKYKCQATVGEPGIISNWCVESLGEGTEWCGVVL